MPRRLVALVALSLVLFGALSWGPARAQDSDPYGSRPAGPQAILKGGPQEFYIHPLAERWSWEQVESDGRVHTIGFLPEGAQRSGWSDAVRMTVYVGRAAPPEGLLVEAERDLAIRCRDLRRSETETRSSARGWAEAWQLLSCSRTLDPAGRRTERGEVHLLRAIQGKSSGYLIRRVWRLPPDDGGIPVGQGEVEAARKMLSGGLVCREDLSGDKACPSYATLGLASIEDEKPYGVFEMRR
jgi:hypothetical protein